jgi:hypothetical protein
MITLLNLQTLLIVRFEDGEEDTLADDEIKYTTEEDATAMAESSDDEPISTMLGPNVIRLKLPALVKH